MARPRSQPPAKFAFLSGIHPDLDDALCEADFKPFAGYEDEEPHHHSRRTSTGNSSSRHHYARFDSSQSVTSKPKEITCNSNESVESLPFSIDGMEKAKRKIKNQAAKIIELEAQLERVASFEENGTADDRPNRKMLSPEERLQAHKERKKTENRHKEVSGRWASPPLPGTESLTSKVKRKDEFVDRLAAEPKERRRQDEVKRRISQTMKKFSGANSENDIVRDSSPLVRRTTLDEELKSLSKNKKKGTNNAKRQDGREDLMKRLNMTMEERRGMESKDTLGAAKRATKARQQRTSGNSSKEIRDHDEQPMVREVTNQPLDYYRDTPTENEVRCQTCGSTRNCEEDADDSGIFYCALCWEEYDNGSDLNQGFEGNDGDEDASFADSVAQSSGDHEVTTQKQTVDRALWIVHDNPTLGNRLVCSGSKKMSCFIETKDPKLKNCVRIIHGTIDYSGPVVKSGGRTMTNIEETERGAECIRLGNICGYVVHHDSIRTRLAKDKSVYEFQLDRSEATELTAQFTLRDFFRGCVGAVDVILDPQSSEGGWYPIREASTGSRKIAPQFRSKGIGYIRLGDDMGNNGQAFMSNDCCKTFFYNEPVGRKDVNKDLLKKVSSFSSKPSYHSRSPRRSRDGQSLKRNQRHSRSDSITVNRVLSEEEDDSSMSSQNSDCESIHAGEVLKELQNIEGTKDMKWKEKAELLMKLGKAVSRPEGRSFCEGALNYIQDIISSKNVNIHVLRSALLVVEKIGHAVKDELPHHIAWNTIMIETLKLLKNKQCGGGAREILQKLHGKCYTLANSLTAISHVLGVGKASSQRKSNGKKGNATPQNKPPTKANNVEIIEWLAVTTEAERLLDGINKAMNETELSLLASFFLSHESHRDARCRQNALDGLLHTMLYGVDVLGMDVDEAQSLCMELKMSKPRSWTKLMKSLAMVLKAERSR